jgi:hypothetical protein
MHTPAPIATAAGPKCCVDRLHTFVHVSSNVSVMQWILSGMPPLVRDDFGSESATQPTSPTTVQVTPHFRFQETKDHVLRVLRDLDCILKMLVASLESSEQKVLTAYITTTFTTFPTVSTVDDPGRSGALSSTGESIKSFTPCRLDLNLIPQTKSIKASTTDLSIKNKKVDIPHMQPLSILSKPIIRSSHFLTSSNNNVPKVGEFETHPASPRRHLTGISLRQTSAVKRDIDLNFESLSGKRRRFSIKHYSDAAPSMHCHVCKYRYVYFPSSLYLILVCHSLPMSSGQF